MVIVSITPEIALDKSVNYAGGLGVLEGDKFYAAGDLGLDYMVLSLLYRHGYVKIRFNDRGEVEFEPEKLSREFYTQLTPDQELIIVLNNARVYIIPWVYRYKTAKAVLFEAVCPEWARRFNERIYIEDSEEEKFLKYALLAKASAVYLRERVGLENIAILDLEESYTSLVLYELRGIENRARIILHTPGPWGHPVFPGYLVKREFGVEVPDLVNMTVESLKKLSKAIVVSKKQRDIMSRVFPDHSKEFTPITNGIHLERWMHPKLYRAWTRGELNEHILKKIRSETKRELQFLIKQYKPEVDVLSRVVITWARRLARYKRPYFIARFIEEHYDTSVVYVLAGKPHPKDPDGRAYLKMFRELSQKFKNVVYIADYSIDVAKAIVMGSDLWLFTPFSGWEACGTSYMKALVNGVPVISSRDGGVIEIVEEGYNGWLFGEDIREFINIYEDPRSKTIDEKDYREFSEKLVKAIETYYNKPDEYWAIALNAWRGTPEKVDIKKVLRKYYFEKLDDFKEHVGT